MQSIEVLEDHDKVPQLNEPTLAELEASKDAKFRPLMEMAECEWLEVLGIFADHSMDTTAVSYVKACSIVPTRLPTEMASEPLERTAGEDLISSNEGAIQATAVLVVHIVVWHGSQFNDTEGELVESAKLVPAIVTQAAPELGPFEAKLDVTAGPSHVNNTPEVPRMPPTVKTKELGATEAESAA